MDVNKVFEKIQKKIGWGGAVVRSGGGVGLVRGGQGGCECNVGGRG